MKNPTKIRSSVSANGFTLMEMAIVVGIIAVILGGAIHFMTGADEGAKLQRVQGDSSSILSLLKMYKINAGDYPTTAQGLVALVKKPTIEPIPRRWIQGPSMVPKDPWGSEYAYKYPGTKNPSEPEIISIGQDKALGTKDDLSSQD